MASKKLIEERGTKNFGEISLYSVGLKHTILIWERLGIDLTQVKNKSCQEIEN